MHGLGPNIRPSRDQSKLLLMPKLDRLGGGYRSVITIVKWKMVNTSLYFSGLCTISQENANEGERDIFSSVIISLSISCCSTKLVALIRISNNSQTREKKGLFDRYATITSHCAVVTLGGRWSLWRTKSTWVWSNVHSKNQWYKLQMNCKQAKQDLNDRTVVVCIQRC